MIKYLLCGYKLGGKMIFQIWKVLPKNIREFSNKFENNYKLFEFIPDIIIVPSVLLIWSSLWMKKHNYFFMLRY